MPIHVNLIPVNEVEETGFKRAGAKAVKDFAAVLEKNGIRATVRRRLGSDINASCGQLRREDLKQAKS
jgi:23S rRNA (adenine2503-C2)-methyltransferase